MQGLAVDRAALGTVADARLRAARRLLLGPAGQTVGALVLALLISAVADFRHPAGIAAHLVAELLLAGLLALGVHEMGHLLGGYLAGFEIAYLVIGPLKVEADEHGLATGINDSPDCYGSVVGMPAGGEDLTRRAATMLVGGAVANLLLALALLLADSAFRAGFVTHLFLRLPAVVSLLTAVAALIPWQRGGALSDGAWLLKILAGGAVAERACALWVLLGLARLGRRPRAWAAVWVERALALKDGSADDVLASNLAYYWALDRRSVGWAGEYLERAFRAGDRAPAPVRIGIDIEAGFYAAHFEQDAETGRAFLDRARAAIADLSLPAAAADRAAAALHLDLLRAEAAVLLAEHRHAEAYLAASRWLALREETPAPLPGVSTAVRDWVRAIVAASAPGGGDAGR